MVTNIVMPNLGAGSAEVVFNEWLVKPGDFVKAGTPIFVVTTDKATVEVETFQEGYIRELRAAPGEPIEWGSVVAILADTMAEPLTLTQAEPPVERPTEPLHEAGPSLTAVRSDGGIPTRILASPLARRTARQEGIDLALVKGTGKHGEIRKRDVQAALQAQPQQVAAAARDGGLRRVPVSSMRRAIAGRTHLSKTQIPHFYAASSIDMTEAESLLKQAGRRAEKHGWPTPTVTDLALRAAALALRQTPQLNASFQGDEIVYYDDVNIGLVIGLPEGMLVPVVHRADRKNLYTLAAVTRRLKEQAAISELSSADLTGATFTLSNLGMFGLDSFVAVINPPEAGVLALGVIRAQPVVREGQVVIRSMMTASLSVDHRLIDGIAAARFMDEFRQLLENPVQLALEGPEEAIG